MSEWIVFCTMNRWFVYWLDHPHPTSFPSCRFINLYVCIYVCIDKSVYIYVQYVGRFVYMNKSICM